MNSTILYTVISLGGIGFILGASLAFASKRFAIEVNPLVEKLRELLPGANCGGCGYAGCAAYAEALTREGTSTTLCSPGGAEVARKIAQLLGKEAVLSTRRVAYLHCAGTKEKAKDRYIYDGVADCRMAVNLGGGPKACDYGCVGFASCVNVCQFDALHMGSDGLPVVDREKCTACGACIRECPRKLFTLELDETKIYLACSSHDKAKAVKDVCTVGCIGCGICVKVTEGDVMTMKDNLPAIDYDKMPNLILANNKCPTHSYIDLAQKRPVMSIDNKCKGTGKCAEVCPVKECITGEPGTQHRIDSKKCIGCGLCLAACPEKAINVVGAMGYVGMDMSR
jgi:Na+-translocating ferredoxin:NAD+ oxidoreductase subunit B